MPRTKADFEGLRCQEFLTKAQAMAYTQRLTEEKFDEDIKRRVHIYRGGKGGCYYVPELRKVMLEFVEMNPTM